MDRRAELEGERATLAKAERDIELGERRVADQERLIGRLRAEGSPTATADALLQGLRDTLDGWRAHRRLILQRIDHLQSSAHLNSAGNEPR